MRFREFLLLVAVGIGVFAGTIHVLSGNRSNSIVGADGKTIIQVSRDSPSTDASDYTHAQPGKVPDSVPSSLPFSEINAVTDCGYNAQIRLRNPDSYSEKWTWQVISTPERGRYSIIRNFTAENGFGGTVAQHYICLLDSDGKGIEFRIEDGYAGDFSGYGGKWSGIR
jgi:hypothetical protein